jgi:hypothetical protein
MARHTLCVAVIQRLPRSHITLGMHITRQADKKHRHKLYGGQAAFGKKLINTTHLISPEQKWFNLLKCRYRIK